MTDAGPFALPVMVGITGHRLIAPNKLDGIERSVLAVLEHVRARVSAAPMPPVTTISLRLSSE